MTWHWLMMLDDMYDADAAVAAPECNEESLTTNML